MIFVRCPRAQGEPYIWVWVYHSENLMQETGFVKQKSFAMTSVSKYLPIALWKVFDMFPDLGEKLMLLSFVAPSAPLLFFLLHLLLTLLSLPKREFQQFL